MLALRLLGLSPKVIYIRAAARQLLSLLLILSCRYMFPEGGNLALSGSSFCLSGVSSSESFYFVIVSGSRGLGGPKEKNFGL